MACQTLPEYDLNIDHMKGKNNTIADALSRALNP